jgi:quercetin dioxygenase-like cupin family protein
MNHDLEARVKAIAGIPFFPDLKSRWLAHHDLGARFGCGIELELEPGQYYPVHRHAGVERVIYVREGEGAHDGSGGTHALVQHDVLVLNRDEWHGFTNTSSARARIWLLYAPVVTFPADAYELQSARSTSLGTLTKRNLLSVADDPTISVPERGFVNMRVLWDGAKGANFVTFGRAFFRPEARHRWHRHPKGDEHIHRSRRLGSHCGGPPDRNATWLL